MSENNGNEFVTTVNETPVQPQVKRTFCKYCGTELQAGTAFCPSCGKPQGNVPVQPQQQQVYVQPQQQQPYAAGIYQQPQPAMAANTAQNASTTVIVQGSRSNGMGTAGFVFSLLAFLVCWVPFVDIIVWFLGALFSFIGLFKAPRGLAIAGFVLSFIGIIILVAFFGAILGFASMSGK